MMTHGFSALPEIDAALRSADRILIASDFDGTLCPIAATPSDAAVPSSTLPVLRSLIACPGVTLAVISGRSLKDIGEQIPFDIALAGNHGLEMAGAGIQFRHPEAERLSRLLPAMYEALEEALRPWRDAWVEDKGLSATIHFRQVPEFHHYTLLFAARRCLGSFGRDFSLRAGRQALEILPRVAWDKGSALKLLSERLGPFGAIVCLGDDRTDETMFQANRFPWNFRVGSPNGSCAQYRLESPDDVAAFLSHIAEARAPSASLAGPPPAVASLAAGGPA